MWSSIQTNILPHHQPFILNEFRFFSLDFDFFLCESDRCDCRDALKHITDKPSSSLWQKKKYKKSPTSPLLPLPQMGSSFSYLILSGYRFSIYSSFFQYDINRLRYTQHKNRTMNRCSTVADAAPITYTIYNLYVYHTIYMGLRRCTEIIYRHFISSLRRFKWH